MDYQQIGRQIRAARLRRKMTQAQLAEAADLSVPYISHVERGKKRVSLDALLRISRALDVTVDQLLSGTQMSVREIGGHVGYRNMSYFSRCFRQQFGSSPESYRRENQAGTA